MRFFFGKSFVLLFMRYIFISLIQMWFIGPVTAENKKLFSTENDNKKTAVIGLYAGEGSLRKTGLAFETESKSCNTIEAGFSISKLN